MSLHNPLRGLDVDRWYLVLIVLSMIGLVASIVAKERVYTGLCFGFVLIGMGELINHPLRKSFGNGFEYVSRRRMWRPHGIAFDLAGVVLVGMFGYRLAMM